MYARIRTRTVASSAQNISALANPAGGQKNGRTDGVAWALGSSNQFQGNPVIAVLHHIAKQGRSRVHIIENDVDAAIIEEVSKRGASGRYHEGQAASRCRRHLLELHAIQISEQLWTLGPSRAPITLVNGRIDMPIGDENIQEAVVVEIQKTRAPPKERNSGTAKSCGIGDIREVEGAVIPVERLVVIGKRGNKKIEAAVAVVVSDGNAHRCLGQTFIGERETREIADVFKRAIVAIAVEIARNRIVGHRKVEPAVIVRIDKHRRKPIVVLRIGDASFLADVAKSAVAVIVKEMVAFARKPTWATHEEAYAAKLACARGDSSLPCHRRMVSIEL